MSQQVEKVVAVLEDAAQRERAAIFRVIVDTLLHYDPTSGIFTWKVNRGRLAKAGDVAGSPSQGRLHIKINGTLYYGHRLAVLLMTGAWPAVAVDHIDGNGLNNAWANLRVCSHSENMQNRKVGRNNKAGLLGVSRHGEAWQATIRVNKRHVHLGRFSDPQKAHEAYLTAKANLHSFNPSISQERASA